MGQLQLVALDIETTGLDPTEAQVVGVGLAECGRSRPELGAEPELLHWIEDAIANVPLGATLVTWNGDEFDLPFLATRFRANNISTTLELTPTGEVGKYGDPVYHCKWGPLRHVDIAPLYRQRADSLGVKWSLKPVARAVLGVEPVEVDRRGESIAQMQRPALEAYLRSDIEITLALAQALSAEFPAPTFPDP